MNKDIHRFIERLGHSSATGYLSDFENHNRVVSNIIKGSRNWSPCELQHYQNFPKEVERAISLFNSGLPVSKQGIVYQSHRFDFRMSYENYGLLKDTNPTQRPCNAVSYLAMALISKSLIESNKEIAVAVAIVDNDNVDVAIVVVGDGVCDIRQVYGGRNISLDMACDMAWGPCSEYVLKIDRAFLVGNHSLDMSTQQIVYKHFGVVPECFVIYYDMLELASKIYEGVLVGDIHDLLVLEVVPMPVGIRISSGDKTSDPILVVDSCLNIPTRNSVEVSTKDYRFPIKVDVLQGDFMRAADKRLWEPRVINSFMLADRIGSGENFNIEIDIDSAGLFKISSTAGK